MKPDRADKLRRLAADPAAAPNEAALALAGLRRMRGDASPRTATVRIEGAWLLATVSHYEEAKEIARDAMGSVGRIGSDLALYTDDPEDRERLADALRGSGFKVLVELPRTVVGHLPAVGGGL